MEKENEQLILSLVFIFVSWINNIQKSKIIVIFFDLLVLLNINNTMTCACVAHVKSAPLISIIFQTSVQDHTCLILTTIMSLVFDD